MRNERRPRAGKRDRKPRVTRLGRFVRGRRFDRNPLRRASDRAETAVLAGLLIAFVAAASFIAQACGSAAHAIAHRVQLTQQASWRQVPAVLLKAAPGDGTGGYAPIEPEALARWTAPDGKAVTGDVPVTLGMRAGATVLIWTTRDGRLTDPPLRNSQVVSQTALAEVIGVGALAVAEITLGLLARRALDKRRMAAWDADWMANGPRWTSRR